MLVTLYSCVNPFAPKIDETLGEAKGLISDQSDVEGVFQNFQYAYAFKDTLIYSQLLNKDFSFSYRDYDIGADISWGRDEEMKVSSGLFQNSHRLDLVWNNINSISGDSTRIVRSFNLTIAFNPTDIIFIDGRVNLTLIKENNKWKILRWVDESNF
ncbi:MAG: hypothetical protein CVV24_05600 [Ignavibacteriae bacterium HGW-Ignavibacteriae-3]|nr:MAG: hypothetical protein CVV24_05600 [Ignavibacteriae bacterium HGW-Ignavibacteriae-3]